MANPKDKKQIKTKKHLAREQREAKQRRIVLSITIVIGVIVLGLVAYGLIENLIIRPNKTVAKVGETTIKVSEFESRVEYKRVQMLNQAYQYYMLYQQFGSYGQSFLQTAQNYATQLTQPVSLASDVLDEIIEGIIIREEAEKRGITLSQEEIDKAIQSSFGFFPERTYTPTVTATIESTPTYSETQLALVTLTSTPTETVTPSETPETTPTPSEDVESTDNDNAPTESSVEEEAINSSDISDDTPTPNLSPTITLTPTITPTPTLYTTEMFNENIEEFNKSYSTYDFNIDDLRAIYETQLLGDKLTEVITEDMIPVEEQVWARHILVETEEEAQKILSELESGQDFHKLAAEYSTDESNKDDGGDLGWFNRDTMVSEFTEVAFNLEIGEISDPVETSFGYHIIQVIGKREHQIPPEDFEQDKQEAFNNWLEQQRNARNDIVIYDEWEDYVSDDPEVPQQFLVELYQASTDQ
jgi:peptidyl-prolyl cis-trans isomerase D